MDPIVGILQKKARSVPEHSLLQPRIPANITVRELEQWLDTHVMPYRGMVTIRSGDQPGARAPQSPRLFALFQQGKAPFKLTDDLIAQYRTAVDQWLRLCAPASLYALWME